MKGLAKLAVRGARLLSLLTLTATSAAAVAQAAGAADADSWQLEKTRDGCSLAKASGGATPTFFLLTTEPGSDDYRLTLAGKTMPKPPGAAFPVAMTLGGSGQRLVGNAMPGKLNDTYPAAYQINGLDAAEVDALAKANSISLTFKGGDAGPYPVADAADAIAAFKECNGELLVAMGADAKQFKPGGKMPVPLKKRETWIDFQTMMAIGQKAGPAMAQGGKFKLAVDQSGKVDNCARIGAPDGDPFQKGVCDTMVNKTLFRPATDASGAPVRGVALYTMAAMAGPPGGMRR